MPEAAFVLPADVEPALRDLVETIRSELAVQAVPSTLDVGAFPEARPGRVYVLLDPWAYVAAGGEAALPDDAVLKRTIFLLAERAPEPGDTAHRALLDRAGDVFAFDPRTRLAVERLQIPCRLLRPGYSPSLDRFDPDAERPIDLVFLGAHTERRTRCLAGATGVLARHRSAIHLSTGESGRHDPATFLGEARWPLLAQSKIVINLHCGEENALEWRRVVDAVHAGAVVVTEHSHGIAPLVPGEHLLVASADAVPYVAETLLRDEGRLAQMRAAAHERLRSWLPFAFPVSVLRAALVELVGEPLPEGASLGTPQRAPEPAPPPRTVDGHATGSFAARREDPEVIAETPAWAARASSEVTVLTAAPAGAFAVRSTLDSVWNSRADAEVVVAVPGSDRDGGSVVQRWMDEHAELAVRLVAAEEDGVAATRSAALAAARGQLCLVLDAGQEIFPRSVDVLAGALADASDVAFVYPIQAVGYHELTSYRPWEAWVARPDDDLHVPALFRADVLREAGAFGVCDRDLWEAMAHRGARGQLVPEPLARRPQS